MTFRIYPIGGNECQESFIAYQLHSKTKEIYSHINWVTSGPHQQQRALPDVVTRDLTSASLYVQCWSRSTTLVSDDRPANALPLLIFLQFVSLIKSAFCASVLKLKWCSIVMAQFLFLATICLCILVANAQFGKQVN